LSITVRGIRHFGFAVRNLERSLAFYERLFGLQPLYTTSSSGPRIDRVMELNNTRLKYAALDLGNTVLELVEYESPYGADMQQRNCDVGAAHAAFVVDDIEEAYRVLQEVGVQINSPPSTLMQGPNKGSQYCYFRDPDGIQLEVYQVAT